MPAPLVKKFAKRSGKTTKQVDKMWNSVKQSLIDQGHSEDNSNFYPMLVGIMKRNLGLKEEYIFLDRFKKLLEHDDSYILKVGILVFQEGKILLGRATNWGRWDLPKGEVDKTDSSPLSAALREMKEETGIIADPSELKLIDKFFYKPGKDIIIYTYYPKNKIKIEDLKCTSMVTDKGPAFPELDKFMFVKPKMISSYVEIFLESVILRAIKKLNQGE